MGNSGFSDSRPAVGSKRSVRDRLGSNVDGIQLNNKRFVLSLSLSALLLCCIDESRGVNKLSRAKLRGVRARS